MNPMPIVTTIRLGRSYALVKLPSLVLSFVVYLLSAWTVWSQVSPTSSAVILPPNMATNDQAFGAGVLGGSLRIQEVYGAVYFPTGALVITELRYRPDYAYGFAFTTTVANIEIRLSTCTNAPDQLSTEFSQNIGADETVVFSGALNISSQFTGPPAGPKSFDIVIPLMTPFVYAPAWGNLLVDIRNFSGSGATPLSGQASSTDSASRLFSSSLTADSGSADSGADTLEIIYTPTNGPPPPPPTPPPTAQLLRGPYLNSGGATSIVVRWRTDVPTDSRVQFGQAAETLAWAVTDPGLTTEHIMTLTNLSSDTRYFYAIGSSAAELAGDPDMFFTTAPPPGQSRSTRIWFVSDYGYADENEIAVRDSYLKVAANSRPADVWLTGGDNDQIVGDDDDIQTSIFGIYAPLLHHTSIWPTFGNHDTYTLSVPGPYPYFDNFTLPTNGEAGGVASASEHYYSFDHGNIHFISLDSITAGLSASQDSPMLRWLRADLAANACSWKIAYWHGPPYSKGSHNSDAVSDTTAYMVQMREQVVPILESYGVDLVLCGHSHVYERSYLLYGHYGYSWTFSETNKVNGGDGREDGDGAYHQSGGKGTVYVVAGVGGRPYAFTYGAHPAHLVKIGSTLGSCLMDVNQNRLDFQFISADAEVLDHFTLLKPTRPRIIYVNRTQNTVTLTWTSAPGQSYRVFMRDSLDGAWRMIADQIPAQGGTTSWSNPLDPAATMEFFSVSTRSD